MRYLGIGIMAMLVMGCLFEGKEDGPKVIGYSYGEAGSCCGPVESREYYAWKLSRAKDNADTFWVYAELSALNKMPSFTKGKIFAALGGAQRTPILDEGSQCLTIEQSGKDTVVVDGKKIAVDIPIEPCLPYLLDKDIP